MFASLPPWQAWPHRDPFAGSLRYHLGCVYREGEDFLFDETFIHRAANDAEQTCIILFCDVERPMRYVWRLSIAGSATTSSRASATANMEGERVGVLNKALAPLRDPPCLSLDWNRKVHYGLKFSIVLGGWRTTRAH